VPALLFPTLSLSRLIQVQTAPYRTKAIAPVNINNGRDVAIGRMRRRFDLVTPNLSPPPRAAPCPLRSFLCQTVGDGVWPLHEALGLPAQFTLTGACKSVSGAATTAMPCEPAAALKKWLLGIRNACLARSWTTLMCTWVFRGSNSKN